ncbi:MAG: thiamine phosphate synthase [Pseudomonadota bacterium]|jgi:thiamine-phosphate pyrophosphorylase|nr:thiamine phosphate synthase [Burkholderiales bacterium]
MKSEPIAIHLLTNCDSYKNADTYFKFIEQCAIGGITHLQLRQKDWSAANLLSFGYELKSIAKDHNLNFIVNDSLALMQQLDADGIHLGQSDISVNQARTILGPTKIIGLSIESEEQLIIANNYANLDYVAASAVFSSPTKTNLKKVWGVDGLKQFCLQSKHPTIAIGGINLNNIDSVINCNVSGVAIISALHKCSNVSDYLAQMHNKLKEHREII